MPLKLCLLKLNFLLSANPFNLKQTLKGNKDNSLNSVNEIQTEIHPFYGKTKFKEKDDQNNNESVSIN